MAKRSASTDKLTIRNLSQEDQDWLKAESDRLGCDPENLVRMMIRQRGAPAPLPPEPPRGGPYYTDDMPSYTGLVPRYDMTPLGEEPPPTINEAEEPTLDQLMASGPSILDDAMAVMQPPVRGMPAYDPFAGRGLRFQREVQHPAAYSRVHKGPPAHVNVLPFRAGRGGYPGGAFGAGSLTRAVAFSGDLTSGHAMGDGLGNVTRDNFQRWTKGGLFANLRRV